MSAQKLTALLLAVLGSIAGTGTAAEAQMSVPPVQLSDPGTSGRRVEGAGWVGNYYPARLRGPALLLLGGSEGALGSATNRIALSLQANGYSVLHLSYFRAPGQPEDLSRVPLELFDRGLAWLAAQPGVDGSRLGVVGGSKGAEAALLVASSHPAVKVTVAGMPSSVVWPGFSWTGAPPEGSSWTRGGKDVPALPYGRFEGSIASVYSGGLPALRDHPDAAIPIENALGPVLLVCGEEDTVWPACPMAEQVRSRSPARVTVLAYLDAGHGVFGPPSFARPLPGPAGLGGTAEGTDRARRASWPRVLAFLHASLGVGKEKKATPMRP